VRTDNLGLEDEPGRLHLPGQSPERYVRGGHNVHAEEVDSVLAANLAVAAVRRKRRRSERGGRGGGGASVGPGPEHTPDPWRICVTLPRSVWPT
jgi:hypothetical protein